MCTCKDAVSLLLCYLDGEMEAEQEKEFHEHLSACPPCVDFLKTYRSTSSVCRRALEMAMPSEVADKLSAFLRTKCQGGGKD